MTCTAAETTDRERGVVCVGISLDTSEVRAVGVSINHASGQIVAKLSRLLRGTAFAIEATGKTLSPVDTGYMRSTIGADISGTGGYGHMTAVIGPTADYAPYVENGTSRMAAQPFMGPAFDRHEPRFRSGVADLGADVL